MSAEGGTNKAMRNRIRAFNSTEYHQLLGEAWAEHEKRDAAMWLVDSLPTGAPERQTLVHDLRELIAEHALKIHNARIMKLDRPPEMDATAISDWIARADKAMKYYTNAETTP